MSWSFQAKGQRKAVKQAVADWKNPYDTTSEVPGIAREGLHIAAVKQAIPEMVDTVLAGAPADAMVDVAASGSEGSYGCDMNVKVTRLQVLYDPPEVEQPATGPSGAGGTQPA